MTETAPEHDALTPYESAEREAPADDTLWAVLHEDQRVFIGPRDAAEEELAKFAGSSASMSLFEGCPSTFFDLHEVDEDGRCIDCGKIVAR